MQRFDLIKIQRVLEAAEETSYYHKLFIQYGVDIKSINSYEDFQKIPITKKEDYRDNMLGFLRESVRERLNEKIFCSEHDDFIKCDEILYEAGLNMVVTSGSTGLPLKVIHSFEDDYRNYFILNLYRRKYANLSFREKYLWIVPMNEKTKQYFYDIKENYLVKPYGIEFFLTSFTRDIIEELHKIIQRYNVKWITGAPTAVTEYGRYLLENNISSELEYIELHSEPLLEWQRDLLQKAFKAKLLCIYSCNEINFIAATCPCGHYHVLQDNVFLELIKADEHPLAYKVVVTGLNYFDTPMIRYEIGDLAREIQCDAQKELAIELLGYRASDFIRLKNGENCEPYVIYDSIFFLNEHFQLNICYYQVIQRSYSSFDYLFEIIMSRKQIAECIKFLEDFLYSALKIEVKVNVVVKKTLQKDAEKKYKRFYSLIR